MKKCSRKTHVGMNPLPFEMFGKNKRNVDGYESCCKACWVIKRKKVYDDNREKMINRTAAWQENNADKIRDTAKRYRANNPEQRQATGKKWRDKNAPLTCHLANKRRANKIKATPPWFENEKVAQLYENCATGYHVHHIVPLQEDPNVCGLHCLANLMIVSEEEHIRIHSDLEQLRTTY